MRDSHNYIRRASRSPLYRGDDITMASNSDNKAGAQYRAYHTFRNNEEYYEIRGQRCYYFANEYLPSAATLIVSGLRRDEKFTRHPSSSDRVRKRKFPRSGSIEAVLARETRFADFQTEYLVLKCVYI